MSKYREHAKEMVATVLPLIEELLIQHWSAALEQIKEKMSKPRTRPKTQAPAK